MINKHTENDTDSRKFLNELSSEERYIKESPTPNLKKSTKRNWDEVGISSKSRSRSKSSKSELKSNLNGNNPIVKTKDNKNTESTLKNIWLQDSLNSRT